VQLDEPVAAPERLLRVTGDRVSRAVAQEARVGRQLDARAPAEQAIGRHPSDLARDVPQRDVDARQRVHRRPVAPDPVQQTLHVVVEGRDLARIAADTHGPEQGVDDGTRGRKHPMAERLAPADDAAVGLDADQQHVDAGSRPPAEHRRGPVDQHRHVEYERLNPCDLHADRASRLP